MKTQTEISLVEKQPHLFHTSILKAYGIHAKNETLQHEDYRFRRGFKESNFFDCGEGWLPIIAAFAQNMEQIQYEYDISKTEDDKDSENVSLLINGAVNHQYRLWIMVDTPSNMDEALINKIKVMQEFATAMSGYICEVCGVPVKEKDLNNHVKCAVCKCRDDQN